jgi:replication-associated recombination protein RarA
MSKRYVRLTEKYRPRKVEDFIGLPKIKAVVSNFLQNPYAAAFLFIGEPGVGKTALALAMADALHSKPLHLASETCNYDNLDKLLRECEMSPTFWNGEGATFHFILIDEIDSTTQTAQRRLLAKLDASELVHNAVFVFTTNTIKSLEKRFTSRCIELEFSLWGAGQQIADFLAWVWKTEGGTEKEPDWFEVISDCSNNRIPNVRACLQCLERELLARGANGILPEEPGIHEVINFPGIAPELKRNGSGIQGGCIDLATAGQRRRSQLPIGCIKTC